METKCEKEGVVAVLSFKLKSNGFFFYFSLFSFNHVSSCHIIIELNINKAFIKRDEDGFLEERKTGTFHYIILLLQTKQ